MLEKTLHTGNIAAAFGTLATTAADLTVCGGAATTIGGLLSGIALFKSNTAAKSLTEQMGKAFKEAMESSPLSDDRKKLIPQIMQKYPVTEDIIAKGNMAPASVAAIICTQIEARRETEDPALIHPAMLTAYEAILTQTLAPVLAQPTGMDPMHAAILKQLLERSDQTGAANKLRDEGITEKAIIRLAQRIASETDDVGQAWLELQNAMDIAVRVQAEGAVGSNHGDFVDEILRRATELARGGEYARAGDEIDEALQKAEAQQMRLLQKGVDVALLDRDTARAAALLVRKADLEAGGVATFEDLRVLQRKHYENGLERARNLDSALAIDIARLNSLRATKPFDLAISMDDLGNAALALAERTGSTEFFEKAEAAFDSALEHLGETDHRKQLAMTQMNLGNLLRIWGLRQSDDKKLEKAIRAYKSAFNRIDRKKFPQEWARISMNLGTAYSSLGEKHQDPKSLEAAVVNYEAALEERRREILPDSWALTKMNLATALRGLGEITKDADRLRKSIEQLNEALDVFTFHRIPAQWARSQHNLGASYTALGELEKDSTYLDKAAIAFGETIRVRTRSEAPLQWAMAQYNLSELEHIKFQLNSNRAHLDCAVEHILLAKEVFDSAKASHFSRIAQTLLDEIEAKIADLPD